MRQQRDFNEKQKKVYAWLEALDHPEKGKRIVHLAGTNGKGSTGMFIAQILSLSSCQVGHFSSPHVISYQERIRINGQPVSNADLARVRSKIIAEQDRNQLPPLFYFEQSFIEALLLFQDVEWIVLESGVGGREDITSIIPADYVVITSISMDHVDKLGANLTAIAGHKADIIEPGKPVFSARQQDEVTAVLEAVAKERQAPLRMLDSSMIDCCGIVSAWKSGQAEDEYRDKAMMTFTWKQGKLAGPYETQMLGYHQVDNAGLALLVAEGLDFTTYEKVERILKEVSMVGRLQKLSGKPPIWVDGAHNNQAIGQLIENMALLAIHKPVILFGMHRGRIAEEVQRELFAKASRVLFVEVEGRSDDQIEKQVHQHLMDLQACGNDKDIVICGSLYILAAAYRFAENHVS